MGQQQTALSGHTVEDQHAAIEFCYTMGWTDGLPVVPPTEAMVRRFLEFGGRDPSEVVLVEPVAGRVITAEKAAANAIMAGCLPEYFPVVLAALDAMGDPGLNLHGATLNTGGAAVMVVVNGPIRGKIDINSGVALFCPGKRANSTIGRALHLVLWNCTGNRPDQMDKTIFGHPGRYSMCIGEREEALPVGWPPLHVERGLQASSNAVTVLAAMHPLQAGYSGTDDPEEILINVADTLAVLSPGQRELMMVLPPELLDHFGSGGWSKSDVREFLYREATRLGRGIRRAHIYLFAPGASLPSDNELVPILERPEALHLVAGGGDGGAFVLIVPLYGAGIHSGSVTRQVKGV